MQWSLFQLILMGQSSFFTCHLYEYHFIGDEKTWNEAQKYCRENYTDLATVFDETDMTTLDDSANQHDAWIGLYNDPGRNKTWHWSLPGVEYYENESWWEIKQSSKAPSDASCVVMSNSHKWIDGLCNHQHLFICYNESMKSNETLHLIKDKMTWPEAQKYCRERYTDLISGYKQLEELKGTNTELSWIGLFRDTWSWSDGSNSSFRNWENWGVSHYEKGDKECAVTRKTSGKWGSDNCDQTKPFFCYEDKVILIKENKTWDEALHYCREHYRDLASIIDRREQRWIQERAKNASTPFVWLGLRYTCTLDLWFWVSDHLVCYDNWASDLETDSCDKSAAMQRGEQHKWVKKADTEVFNFICALP